MEISDSLQNVTTLPECPIFPDHPEHCTALISVRRVFASVSLIGCIFMILVIWLFKRYAAFAQRLILYLSIGALNLCISYLMGELHPDGPLCSFQAWWMSFFDWTVLMWISAITFNLYMNAVYTKTTENLEWLYHVVCWGIPLIMSCLPFAGDVYGPAGAWCWIIDDWRWRIGMWYGPLVVVLVILVIVYTSISCVLSRKASTWEGTYDPDTERYKLMLKEDIKPLRMYPFIYLAVSVFPLINRIQNAVNIDHPVFALMLLAAISAPLNGALNAIVFGMDRDTFHKLTPSQLKLALSRHRLTKSIHEYPTMPHQVSSHTDCTANKRLHDNDQTEPLLNSSE